MILTCPSCSTRYLSDPASLQPNGRMVRCANCGHSWFQKPPEDMPKQVATDAPRLGGVGGTTRTAAAGVGALGGAERFTPVAEARPRRRRGISASMIAVWLLVLVALGVLAAALYQYRVELVRSWPQTASVYELVGINVTSAGLVFRGVETERAMSDGLPVLIVHGQVVNVTDQALPIPRIKISLRDEAGEELYYWTFALQQTRIGPGASTDFTTSLSSPPIGASELEASFAEDRE